MSVDFRHVDQDINYRLSQQTMTTVKLRHPEVPSLEIGIRQCGRFSDRIFESPSRVTSAAHRAYCRAPGRPQTAAFAPQRTDHIASKRPTSAGRTTLKDCMITQRAALEPRSDSSSITDDDTSSTGFSKSAVDGSRGEVGVAVSDKEQRRRRYGKPPRSASATRPSRPTSSAVTDVVRRQKTAARQATVADATVNAASGYKAVGSSSDARSETSVANDTTDDVARTSSDDDILPAVVNTATATAADICESANVVRDECRLSTADCDAQFDCGDVTQYVVEIQANDTGCRLAAGLGHRELPENIALLDLLQRQLELVSNCNAIYAHTELTSAFASMLITIFIYYYIC